MDPIAETPGAAPEPHLPGPRRMKHRLVGALLALHVAALFAAGVIVIRTRGDGAKKQEVSGKSLLNLSPKDTVGWVSIRGPIMSSESGKPWERGAEQWAKRIEQLADTKGVKAIVLDINSPGGSVGAVQEIYSRILRVKELRFELMMRRRVNNDRARASHLARAATHGEVAARPIPSRRNAFGGRELVGPCLPAREHARQLRLHAGRHRRQHRSGGLADVLRHRVTRERGEGVVHTRKAQRLVEHGDADRCLRQHVVEQRLHTLPFSIRRLRQRQCVLDLRIRRLDTLRHAVE